MADRHDDRSLELMLDRFWDESFLGEPAGSEPSNLETTDPGLAATVRRVHALNLAPAANSSFADRLWEDLMYSQSIAGTLAPHPISPVAPGAARPVAPRLRPPGRLIPTSRPRLQWALSQFGIAALLIVMLGLGYVAYRAGFNGDDRQPTAPAAVQSASPSPEAESTAQTEAEGDAVLRVELPPEVLAALSNGSALTHLTVPPGNEATWTVPQAALLHYVVSGTLTVTPVAPAQALRAGETAWAPVAAGEALVLRPGDALLLVDDVSAAYANDGAVPVETVTWLLGNARAAVDPIPPAWTTSDLQFGEGLAPAAHPGSAAVLQLRRIVLEPNGELPAPPAGESRLRVGVPFNDTGTPVSVSLTRRADGYAFNYGTDSVLIFEVTVTFGGPSGSDSPAAASG
jgi:hypothetical protein